MTVLDLIPDVTVILINLLGGVASLCLSAQELETSPSGAGGQAAMSAAHATHGLIRLSTLSSLIYSFNLDMTRTIQAGAIVSRRPGSFQQTSRDPMALSEVNDLLKFAFRYPGYSPPTS
jgi:hypothetical protein